MQDDSQPRPPSLIKLGKLANTQQFEKLSTLWPEAVVNPDHPVEDLLALCGQVYRLGQRKLADTFASSLLAEIEQREGAAAALTAVRTAVQQLPTGATSTRDHLLRLYAAANPGFAELPGLLALLAGPQDDLAAAVRLLDRYCALAPGGYLVDYNHVVPGVVESVDPARGIVRARFGDRSQEYGPSTVEKAVPRPPDFFPALLLYDPDRLRDLAAADPSGFVKLAIQSDLDGVLSYKNLRQHVTRLLGDKGWQSWWKTARETLRRDPLLNASAGTQPSFTLRRQADRYEDRLRRRFERTADPLEQLRQVLDYLEEIGRKQSQYAADEDLLVFLGNAAAKIAVGALPARPAVALAALAVHARVAARGVAIADRKSVV